MLQASATAKVLIAGQAPGRRAHESGIPFDDISGDRLRAWLGIDLPPRKECAATWRRRLLAGMPGVKLTVLIGIHAQRWHLGEACGRTLLR